MVTAGRIFRYDTRVTDLPAKADLTDPQVRDEFDARDLQLEQYLAQPITTGRIADGAVTTGRIADNAVTIDKLGIGLENFLRPVFYDIAQRDAWTVTYTPTSGTTCFVVVTDTEYVYDITVPQWEVARRNMTVGTVGGVSETRAVQSGIGTSPTSLTNLGRTVSTDGSIRFGITWCVNLAQHVGTATVGVIWVYRYLSGVPTQVTSAAVYLLPTYGFTNAGFVTDKPAAGTYEYRLMAGTNAGTIFVASDSQTPATLRVFDTLHA